ncbi:hypothetical protein BDV09DRAFT_77500 [Aspergillus tetrazonus]
MTEKTPLRPLLPAIALTTAVSPVLNDAKQKRRSLACTTCQKRQTKVLILLFIWPEHYLHYSVPVRPHATSVAMKASCIFDARRDMRRKFALKKAEHTQDTLIKLIALLRQGTPDDILKLKADMETCVSTQDAMERLSLFLTNPPALFASHKL